MVAIKRTHLTEGNSHSPSCSHEFMCMEAHLLSGGLKLFVTSHSSTYYVADLLNTKLSVRGFDTYLHWLWLLIWFEDTQELGVNLDESELVLVGSVDNVEDLALEFGCKVGCLPSVKNGINF